jgi:uncharacterized membrane protein
MVLVHQVYDDTLSRVVVAVCYLWLQFGLAWVVMTLLLWPTTHRPRWRGRRFTVIAIQVGALNIMTDSLVLLAMMTNKITYVVGFRQLSVAIGVVLGIVILHDRQGMAGRLIGVGIITVGLVLISIAR